MKLFVRFCDNVWTFILRDVEFRDVDFDSLLFLSAKEMFIILLKYVNSKYMSYNKVFNIYLLLPSAQCSCWKFGSF